MLAGAGKLGHEVIVVAPGPRDEETRIAESGRIVRYRAPRMPYDPSYHAPISVGRMRALVKRFAPDVLQLSSPFVPAWVGATLRVPLRVYVYHSDPIGCYLTPLAARGGFGRLLERAAWGYLRRVCATADVTVVSGEWLERELTGRGFVRVHTVPFGIDHELFGSERRDEGLRREILGSLADDPDARLVLIAGRLAFDKRQLRLIEALEIPDSQIEARNVTEAIAQAIERLFARPLADLGQRARARARRLPSTENHFRALFELYAARLAVRSPRAE